MQGSVYGKQKQKNENQSDEKSQNGLTSSM